MSKGKPFELKRRDKKVVQGRRKKGDAPLVVQTEQAKPEQDDAIAKILRAHREDAQR